MKSSIERVFSDNNNLYVFFHNHLVIRGQVYHHLWVNQRLEGGTTWGVSTLIEPIIYGSKLVSVSKTSDGKMNIT